MPRLFTAIEIPHEVALSLSMLRGGLPGARWVDPENYHITLRFIGDVDRHTANEIVSALTRTRRGPLQIRLAGLDVFGGNKPHSIYAAVEKTRPLVELQAEHERIMRRLGLKAETRKFAPHVTIARLRNSRDGDIAKYLSLRGNFSLPAFNVERIAVYSSRDSVGGGPYLLEETVALNKIDQEAGSRTFADGRLSDDNIIDRLRSGIRTG
jgi:RNA 2',3'-cyclic 3'-phosphodiesterase